MKHKKIFWRYTKGNSSGKESLFTWMYIYKEVPGLCINKNQQNGWSITHLVSGLAVLSGIKSLKKAELFLPRFNVEGVDWWLSEDKIKKLEEKIRPILQEIRKEI